MIWTAGTLSWVGIYRPLQYLPRAVVSIGPHFSFENDYFFAGFKVLGFNRNLGF